MSPEGGRRRTVGKRLQGYISLVDWMGNSILPVLRIKIIFWEVNQCNLEEPFRYFESTYYRVFAR
jgi:hypothetical protein